MIKAIKIDLFCPNYIIKSDPLYCSLSVISNQETLQISLRILNQYSNEFFLKDNTTNLIFNFNSTGNFKLTAEEKRINFSESRTIKGNFFLLS